MFCNLGKSGSYTISIDTILMSSSGLSVLSVRTSSME